VVSLVFAPGIGRQFGTRSECRLADETRIESRAPKGLESMMNRERINVEKSSKHILMQANPKGDQHDR
jgi:hypothetical protein